MMWWRRNTSRYKHWTSPPAAPIRYGAGARLSDSYNGMIDGRGGLPDPRPRRTGESPQTPSTRLLTLRAEVQQGSEKLRFSRKLAENPADTSVDRLRSELKAAEQRAADKRALLEAIPAELDAQSAAARRAGERDTREDVVRSRRAAEHAALRQRAESEYRAAVEQVAPAYAALERAVEAANREADVERARHEWIDLHAQRRTAAYFRRLVRSHRAGLEVAEYLSERQAPDGRIDEGGIS